MLFKQPCRIPPADAGSLDEAETLDFRKFRVIILSDAKSHPASTLTTEPRAAGAVPELH